MLGRQNVLLLVLLSLSGCPADGDGQRTGTEGASGAGSSETGSSSSGDPGPSFEEFAEMCAAQFDEAGCVAVESFNDPAGEPQFASCFWESSVPVELLDNDECVFGEPTGRCRLGTSTTEGCGSGTAGCEDIRIGRHAALRETEGGVELVHGGFCTGIPFAAPCVFDDDGVLREDGPPECECLCAPDFPG